MCLLYYNIKIIISSRLFAFSTFQSSNKFRTNFYLSFLCDLFRIFVFSLFFRTCVNVCVIHMFLCCTASIYIFIQHAKSLYFDMLTHTLPDSLCGVNEKKKGKENIASKHLDIEFTQ